MASINIIFAQVICLIVFGHMVSTEEQSKRLLLDGDTTLDLGAEINKLRTQLMDFQNKYASQMNATNTTLVEVQKENEMLKQMLVKSQDFQNITKTKLVDIQKENEILKQMLVKSQGEGQVYVRWGRNVCPATANFIYKGYMAGKYYYSRGSGTNHLCLPHDPTWLNFTDGVNADYKAFIFGTEFDTDDNQHIFGYPVHQQDIPCVVCQSRQRATMMVPARGSCYSGWTREYRGYIMAGADAYGAYEYICVDEHPEFLDGGSTDDNQHTLYTTEGRCGSLPCPPYVDGRELACVLCSK